MKCAMNNLPQTNIAKSNTAPECAQPRFVGIKGIRSAGKADVYNMEVQCHHNFTVNGGIVVHNCMDSVRYFVHTSRIVEDYKRRRGA